MSAITNRIKRALNHGGPSMGYIVLSDAGTPRAITKVEITEDAEKGTFALEVTATSVAAGDTIHADLYLMA